MTPPATNKEEIIMNGWKAERERKEKEYKRLAEIEKLVGEAEKIANRLASLRDHKVLGTDLMDWMPWDLPVEG